MNPDEYLFLKDEPLHKDYDLCSPDTSTQECVLCIFSINAECSMKVYSDETGDATPITMPFLKYLVEKTPTQVQFPQFMYTCVDTDNSTQLQNEAMVALTVKLGLTQTPTGPTSTVPQTPTGPTTGTTVPQTTPQTQTSPLETAYQGFILHDQVLYMFYNYDVILQHFSVISPTQLNQIEPTNTSAYGWAIVDELVFQRHVDGVPVINEIGDLFRANPILWNIEYQGTYLDFPFCLYGVEENNDHQFINETRQSTKQTTSVSPYVASKPTIGRATDTYVFGEEYGEMYLFSNTAIGSTTSLSKYAVFVSGCKYLLNTEHHDTFMKYMASVLPPDAHASDVSDTHLSEQSDKNGEEEENGEGEEEKEEEDNSEISVIYFVEPSIQKQLWGVRHTHRFVSLT